MKYEIGMIVILIDGQKVYITRTNEKDTYWGFDVDNKTNDEISFKESDVLTLV